MLPFCITEVRYSLYKTPVTNLNGIGEKRAALFARLGIKSVGDLINFYPRTYEDWSNIKHIDDLNTVKPSA